MNMTETRKMLEGMSELEVIKIALDENEDKEVRKLANEVIYLKYKPMILKHWLILQKQMNDSPLINSYRDEYFSRAAEEVLKVIRNVKLDRVYNEKFKLMQLMSWAFCSLRADIIEELTGIKKGTGKNGDKRVGFTVKSTTYMNRIVDKYSDKIDSDVEEAYWEAEGDNLDPAKVLEAKESARIVEEAEAYCLSKWSDKKKLIYKLLKEKKDRTSIARELHMTKANLYNHIMKMKEDMKKALGVD